MKIFYIYFYLAKLQSKSLSKSFVRSSTFEGIEMLITDLPIIKKHISHLRRKLSLLLRACAFSILFPFLNLI